MPFSPGSAAVETLVSEDAPSTVVVQSTTQSLDEDDPVETLLERTVVADCGTVGGFDAKALAGAAAARLRLKAHTSFRNRPVFTSDLNVHAPPRAPQWPSEWTGLSTRLCRY